ncbi:restriction endonuclease subunit S [Aeromonas enteropelogenes]|uniref:restriction endonuclease subunit S n=1 Tax=Aeromonas enteropelogenes TaxID=29489 RepID=UPI000F52629E|nr:restriction endonuclease subunit S [Aeromonas enteropelogenes]RQM58467.1 restriction endonuclease subunit S [Aeromonas enteropelogenes]
MSNVKFLDKLLDGVLVEWKALGEVAKYSDVRIDSNQVNKKNYVGVDNLLQNGAGKADSNYVPTEGRHIEYRSGDVLIGNIRPYLKKIWLADQAGGTNGDVLVIRSTHPSLSSGYLHQVLMDDKFFAYNMQHARGAKMPRGDKAKILEYCIPIPCPNNPEKSLEIQAEIVRILDTFTELTNELTNELTARKKQYNHYRDLLLSFEDGDVEWKPLGKIGEFIRGKRFTKADYVDNGINVIHYGEIYTRYGVFTDKAFSQVREDMANSLRYAESGDVVITDVGETVEDVGKAVAWLGNGRVAIHDHCYAFRHSMNPKFVSYCMQTASFIAEKAKYVARTKVNTLLVNGFSKISIPVPYPNDSEKSLAEQARIVAILDKFDALTTSITEGLPCEIELRQKQYTYYRELLLNFLKPEAVEV